MASPRATVSTTAEPHPGVAPIEEPDRLEVGGGRGHQPGAVLDRAGHDVLVREHGRLSGPVSARRRSGPRWRVSTVGVRLLVDVQAGLVVDPQHAPVHQLARAAAAAAAGWRPPAGRGAPRCARPPGQGQGLVAFDDVVRRGEHPLERHLGRVPDGAESARATTRPARSARADTWLVHHAPHRTVEGCRTTSAQPFPRVTSTAWYRTGLDLLEAGRRRCGGQILSHAVAAEPSTPSLREALARAEFDAGRYADARRELPVRWSRSSPDNDYALFGLGLAESRLGLFVAAAEHLALAAVMRPDRAPYAEALRQARATLRAREEANGGQGIDA